MRQPTVFRSAFKSGNEVRALIGRRDVESIGPNQNGMGIRRGSRPSTLVIVFCVVAMSGPTFAASIGGNWDRLFAGSNGSNLFQTVFLITVWSTRLHWQRKHPEPLMMKFYYAMPLRPSTAFPM